MTELMDHGTLIEAEALAPRLGSPRLRVFDCRFDLARPSYGSQSYREAHLPGAAYADLNRDLSAPPTPSSGRHPLPDPESFAARLRAWGVDDGSEIVAYDDGSGMFAARLWWMLRWLGHDRVAVLNGGLARWRQLGLPLSGDLPRPVPGNFRARPRPGMTADIEYVAAIATDAGARLLDARGPERYRGETEPIDRVAGHVPGARNQPYGDSVGRDGRLLPAAELRELLASGLAGIAAERTVVMCGSGVSACHLLLAMEHAGLGGARLYPGSWSQWSSDPARPVATGEMP
ncbi:MAG TPA: sulfurtransferase [Steroidobacteraceae bacterium]|nr:sulfurtransferase [Steroidobacteraceae bacterium]